jgi:hypothetical protein
LENNLSEAAMGDRGYSWLKKSHQEILGSISSPSLHHL